MVTVELTAQQWTSVLQLINAVNGMENARVLLPIHDAIKRALENAEAAAE